MIEYQEISSKTIKGFFCINLFCLNKYIITYLINIYINKIKYRRKSILGEILKLKLNRTDLVSMMLDTKFPRW